MDAQSLLGKTNTELTTIYNGLLSDGHIGPWKGKKDVLVDRILTKQAEIDAARPVERVPGVVPEGTEFHDVPDGAIDPVVTEDEALETMGEWAQDELYEPDEAPEKDEPAMAAPTRTIRAASLDLLCRVAYHEDKTKKSADDNRIDGDDKNARSVGLAYDEIIRAVQDEFPGCSTTVACLRWYAVKVRVEEFGYEGLRLPQRRPRVKPARS